MIELLVVIAIIGILAAMLLPALAQARQTAKRIECASTLKQVSISTYLYTDDHDGWMLNFRDGYLPYVGSSTGQYSPEWWDYMQNEIRYCPSVWRSTTTPSPGGFPVICSDPNNFACERYMTDWFASGYTMSMGYANWNDRMLSGPDRFYVRPFRDTPSAYYSAGTLYDATGGFHWNTFGTVPIASCPIVINAGSARYCTPHAGGYARTTYPQALTGANSVWADGHVQWRRWSASDYVLDNRTRLAGFPGYQPEGWTQTFASSWVWMKRGTR